MVELRPFTERDLDNLWEYGHDDEFWPLLSRDKSSFRTFVNEHQAAQFIGYGDLCAVYHDMDLVGFVVYGEIAPHDMALEVTAVECGTFLLERSRGVGLNVAVKRALLRRIFEGTDVDYALFAIRTSNPRALSAQRKLPWKYDVSTPQGDGPFVKYCRRKSWETSQEVHIYSVKRCDFFID